MSLNFRRIYASATVMNILPSRGLLDILASASEFNELPVRQQEEKALRMLAKHLPQKVDDRLLHWSGALSIRPLLCFVALQFQVELDIAWLNVFCLFTSRASLFSMAGLVVALLVRDNRSTSTAKRWTSGSFST